ncbi:MAG: periplasmic heavy metal sensor [Deltaproteobacteria bacterium]|nr:periplasmic heavy metal sensor [Deltaproteobacteria bacterium]
MAGTNEQGLAVTDVPLGQCLVDSLKLDTAQQERLSEMRRKMDVKRAAFWQRAAELKAELAEAICASKSDRTGIDPLLSEYAKNQAGMQRAVAEHLSDVSTMLRPKQQERFRMLLRTKMFRGIGRSSAKAPRQP